MRDGVTATSMASIATEGGVSKALLHYHYASRAGLLVDIVALLGRKIITRERAAMDTARGSGAVDALWGWLQGELALGELRALLELALQNDDAIRAAAADVGAARLRAASQTVEQLFAGLGLTPRLPAPLLGRASVAFMDGLAVAGASAGEARASFDLFWLALLSIAE